MTHCVLIAVETGIVETRIGVIDIERETRRVRVWCIVVDEVHVIYTEVRTRVRRVRWSGSKRACAGIVTGSGNRSPIYSDSVLRAIVGCGSLPKERHRAEARNVDLFGVIS